MATRMRALPHGTPVEQKRYRQGWRPGSNNASVNAAADAKTCKHCRHLNFSNCWARCGLSDFPTRGNATCKQWEAKP